MDRQPHTTTANIPIIIMIQMQSRVPVKNGNKRLYPAKITRELLLCATATTTTVDAKSLTFFSRSCFRAHMYENMKVTLAELIKNGTISL